MRQVKVKSVSNVLDLDYGEGYLTFAWCDELGIDRQLTIDSDGHCSREMPIRSGTGVQIGRVSSNGVQLTFTPDLAAKLELETEIEFVGDFSSGANSDLQLLAEHLANRKSA